MSYDVVIIRQQWLSSYIGNVSELIAQSDELHSRIGDLLQNCSRRFYETAEQLLITLKIELRLQTIAYLQPLLRPRPSGLVGGVGVNQTVHHGSTPLTSASDPDPCVRELSKNILEQDMLLSSVLTFHKMKYVM